MAKTRYAPVVHHGADEVEAENLALRRDFLAPRLRRRVRQRDEAVDAHQRPTRPRRTGTGMARRFHCHVADDVVDDDPADARRACESAGSRAPTSVTDCMVIELVSAMVGK